MITSGNRQYKDRLFKMLFGKGEEANALSLYNAMNGSNYTDPSQLEIYTIDDAVYLGMQNDVSFIINEELCLYEQQSTFNPNMSIRGLMYFAKQYEKLISDRQIDIYGTTRVTLPTPKYVVFYNGSRNIPELSETRLSDAFEKPGCMELVALVININYGNNADLFQKCQVLKEYSRFIYLVEQCRKTHTSLKTAIDEAIDRAIEENVLKDYLLQKRAEVKDVLLTEYNEKLHLETLYREGTQEGFQNGFKAGKEEGILTMITFLRGKGYSSNEIDLEIANCFHLSLERAKKYVRRAELKDTM